jgi:hypothetical protein
MKIAICYSGKKRSWDQCVDSHIKNLIDDRCVIFSCTDQPLDGINVTRHINIDDNKLSLYKDKFEAFHTRKKPETSVFNCLNMYYSIYKVNQLKSEYEIENNMLFDVVIRVRPDLFFNNSIKNDAYNISPNTIILPIGIDHSGLCDQFWYSDTKGSDSISSLFIKIGDYFTSDGVVFHPETFLMHHCNKLNMSVDRSNVMFNILR